MTYLFEDLEKLRNEYQLSGDLSFSETYIPGVRLFCAQKSVELNPLQYPAGIAILCQGEKQGMFGDSEFAYDEDNFLIVSVSTPIRCHTIASHQKPAFGLFIDIELTGLESIVKTMSFDSSVTYFNRSQGVEPVTMGREMKEVVAKLLKTLTDPIESKVLGQGIRQELIFRALQSDHGDALYALTQDHSPHARVLKVVDHIKQNYSQQMTVEQLAELASMSQTSFHRSFKLVVGESPLQYVKKVKLGKARSLIVHEGKSVSAAALEVGYNSTSQFTREFKRYFNVTPTKAKDSGYAQIDVWSEE